ncbi:MAG TPA: dTMP kinase [Levilinea sp.]|nr:dTMP kinase [Levilinea sp.]
MFITLEGPDGSGKTSHINPLAEFLRQRGYDVLTTREPGGTAISDQVRAVLTRMENKAMSPRTEILLFCAARAQLVDEVIRPHLSQGQVVLSDRYADSTLAYQGYGHQYDREFLRRLLDFTTGCLWPDLTVLLDIESRVGLQRKQSAGGEWNRLDDYELAFHQRVRQGYHEMARFEPQRWRVVDASRGFEEVQTGLRQLILAGLQSFQV